MAKRKPITITPGDRFGSWTVLAEIEKQSRNRRLACVCDCGTHKSIFLISLVGGHSKSCGCATKFAAYTVPGMKRCNRCGETLPFSEFYARRDRGKTSLSSNCKPCKKILNAERMASPRVKAAALKTARAWKINNRAKNKATRLAWEEANPDKHIEGVRRRYSKWRAANPDLARARTIASHAKNPEGKRRTTAAWAKANPHLCRAKYKRYMSAKIRAVPAWINDFFVEEAYELAQLRSSMKALGHAEWHVDHQVPLQSKLVCGLHVHDNLQVIPGALNMSKQNRFWPDMP